MVPLTHFSIYDRWPIAGTLRHSWNELLLQSDFPNVFMTWEWTSIWWKWFGQTNQLRLCVVWDGQYLVGIAPFYVSAHPLIKIFSGRALRWVGDGAVVYPDFLGPIVRPADASRFADILASNWDSIMKRGELAIFPDSLISMLGTRALVESLSPLYSIHRQKGERCPYLSLPPNYEEFLEHLGKRQRETIRRRMRKAFKNFNIELKCVKIYDEIDSSFNLIRNIFANSERGKKGNTCFMDEQYFGFHRDIGKAFSQTKWLRLYILYFDGAPVAFLYGYLYGGRYWFYQTAFMSQYHEHGPGSILMQLVIAAAIEEGAKTFEFLRGEEPYKYHFADGERATDKIALLPGNGISTVLYRVEHLLKDAKNDINNAFSRKISQSLESGLK